jgi:hypothetical protein
VESSEDPTSVLQEGPSLRSASLNLTVLVVSLAMLLWTILLWPLSALLRRADRASIGVSAEVQRLRLCMRGAVAFDLLYLLGWLLLMQPLASSQVQVYGRPSTPS